MPKFGGEITFGIGEEAIEAVWKRQHGYVTYYLSKPLEYGPYAGRLIINKPIVKWHNLLPYEMAGAIINETLAERKVKSETHQSAKSNNQG